MMDRLFQRENSVSYSSSHSALDGIPFRIGSSFTQKHKVASSADLKFSRVNAVEEEYDFSLEEGVLKWADERQKQLAAQQRIEEQLQLARAQEQQQAGQESSDDSGLSDHEYENEGWTNNSETAPTMGGARPPPVSRKQPPPRPVLPKISNDILTPVNVSNQNDSSNEDDGSSKKPVDFSLFETEDDPFDRFERLTLNDLTELKSVFDNNGNGNNKEAGSGSKKSEGVYENTKILNNPPNGVVNSASSVNHSRSDKVDGGDYVELDITKKPDIAPRKKEGKIARKQKTYKGKIIPPVPPRPSLSAKGPLPPIGSETSNGAHQGHLGAGKSTYPFEQDIVTDSAQVEPVYKKEEPSGTYENVSLQTDQRTVNFSKTPSFGIVDNVNDSSQSSNPFLSASQPSQDPASRNAKAYVNVAPVKSTGIPISGMPPPYSAISPVSDGFTNQSQDLPLPLTISPPPRPSSKQSWNRYSPLPQPAQSGFTTGSPSSLSSGSLTEPKTVVPPDPYSNLPADSRRVVDSVASMGFPKAQAARAVEKLGADQKEVIDYLCVVGKLTDKGHNSLLVEETLALFKNNSEKSERFLALFKQFQELGFSDLRIKEELVKNDLDSDKTLDSLTA
eukprot:XP_011427005.1 PREDICTED: probable histone-lysine N-methyltransferase set-2 isoform X2 [Crassostrea gigas]